MSERVERLKVLCKPGRSDWAVARDREEALAVFPVLLKVAEAAQALTDGEAKSRKYGFVLKVHVDHLRAALRELEREG